MREVTTTLLDALGLILSAVGIGTIAYGAIVVWNFGPQGFWKIALGGGFCVTGLTLLFGTLLADKLAGSGGSPRSEP